MVDLPPTIRLARWLLLLSAAIWLAFGVLFLFRLPGVSGGATPLIVSALMFGAAVVFAALAIGIGRRSRLAYRLALAWMAANVVLTFTDQVGPADLAYLALSAVILALLLGGRRAYLH